MEPETKRTRLWPWVLTGFLLMLPQCFLLWGDLPYYSIDENEVVEAAVAVQCGNGNPYFFIYGPFFAYVLSGIYLLTGAIQGLGPEAWVQRYFADPSLHYLLGRVLHLLTMALCLPMGLYMLRNKEGAGRPLLAVLLLSAPVAIAATGYCIRIDSMVGFLSLCALHFAAQWARDAGKRPYLWAGVLTGLVVATKPLTGMLLFAPMLGAHLLATCKSLNPCHWRPLKQILCDKRLWICLVASFVAHSLVNPYSLVELRAYLAQHKSFLLAPGPGGGQTPGYDLLWFFRLAGPPLGIFLLSSCVLGLRNKSRQARLLALHCLVHLVLFSFTKVRIYWFNAFLPSMLLLTAQLLQQRLSRIHLFRRPIPLVALGVLLVLIPFLQMVQLIHARSVRPERGDRAAQQWIETELPADTKLYMAGFYSCSLPRVVANDMKKQGHWGEYFMYLRNLNSSWVAAFEKAYTEDAFARPRYGVANFRRTYDPHPPGSEMAIAMESLPQRARKQGARYLITGGFDNFHADWEKGPKLTRVAAFTEAEGYRRPQVQIFRLEDE